MKQAESYEEIVLNSNKAVIQLIKNQDFVSAKPYLDTSLHILSSKQVRHSKKLLQITLNNYGCYYKRLGYQQESLEYFYKALNVSSLNDSNLTETYLNISNVLTQSGDLSEALKAGLKALHSIQDRKKYTETAVLVYQALGNIYSAMQLKSESQQMYLKGIIISQKIFGNSHHLTKELESLHNGQRKKKNSESQFLHDFIPMPVDYSRIYPGEKTIKNLDIKNNFSLSPKKSNFFKKDLSQKTYKFRKIRMEKTVLHKRDLLTPIPKRSKFSVSSPRLLSRNSYINK